MASYSVAFLALLATPAFAQVDPFAPGGGGAPAADPFGGGAAAAPPAGAPAAGDEAASPLAPIERVPLVIQQFRDLDPTTPPDLMRAARAVLLFGREDEAKRYLAKLIESKPADEALAPLASSYGDFLMQLSRREDVQPEGRQAADLIFGAAQRVAQDPARIDALIKELSNDDIAVRSRALERLMAAGTHAINPLLKVLADPAREKEHPFVRAALARMTRTMEQPLLAALESPNEALQAQVMLALGQMGSHLARAQLVRPAVDPAAPEAVREAARAALVRTIGAVPDRYEAERYLAQETARLIRGEIPYRADPDARITLWMWDEAEQEVVPRRLSQNDAALLLATRTANDLYRLRAGDANAQRLMLLTNLDLAKSLGGLDKPLAMDADTAGGYAIEAGPQTVSQVLADAMELGRVPAAIAAAEVLGHLGDASVLLTHDGRASPLAEAMVHSDRRVRLAAALASLKLAPAASFPGASRMSDAFGWFAGTAGEDFVVIGHPRSEDAQTLVGLMNGLGLGGQAAYVGRSLAEAAFVNPDIQFVLISDAIDLPPVKELVQWLRRDFRTARLPVGVMARGELLDEMQFAFRNDPYTTVFPRIHSLETAAFQVERLREVAGRNLVPRDERLDQAAAALSGLATLAKDESNFARHNLLRHEPAVIKALYNPALTPDAAEVLALFASPRSQTALVDYASQFARPLAGRQSAAAAFAEAVKRRGLRLTKAQIVEQYARYNASEKLDAETQAVLGGILDAIEAPAIARGELTQVE